MIWPSRRTHDLLLSVGTGYADTQGAGNLPDRHFPAGWGPMRLWRAYNASPCMDGMAAYREGRVHVPSALRSNTIRLDHALDGELPRLDDVGKLAELAALPFTVPDELVRAVWATCFFFELDAAPSRTDGSYHLRGSVLCARTHARRIVDQVLVEFPRAHFQSGRGQPLGRVDDDDGCPLCGYYRKQVTLSVPSLDEEITIALASAAQQRPIGGFPTSIRQLLQDQQADAVFGRPDHQEYGWPPRRSCYCGRTTKRRVHFVEPAPERKKRRL